MSSRVFKYCILGYNIKVTIINKRTFITKYCQVQSQGMPKLKCSSFLFFFFFFVGGGGGGGRGGGDLF